MLTEKTWYHIALDLLEGSYARNDEKTFCDEMNILYNQVKMQHEGRCISKKIFDDTKRQEMIQNLFVLYHQNRSVKSICESVFMRKLTRHNKDNEDNLGFISINLVPFVVGKSNDPSVLLNLPEALNWLTQLNATIINPQLIRRHRTKIRAADQRYVTGSQIIKQKILFCHHNDWLSKEKVSQIIDGIKNPPKELNKEMGLTNETVVEYFINLYLEFIETGRKYKEVFKICSIDDLKRIKRNPDLPLQSKGLKTD
jgi:hypothetical protein